MGREYRVVPATLVQSQVLNNNLGRTFLPPEAITDSWAQASNDAPVVLDHPTMRGQPISARGKDVLNARGLGRIYNVRVQNGALKGDVFLDPSRRSTIPELGVILAAIEAGQPTELSTGFPVNVTPTPGGVHNGEAFDVTITPAGPLDHLAVFADKRGACSVKDGCGLGVNHEGPCDDEATPEAPPALPSALPEVPEPAANEAGESPSEERHMDREQMIAQLAQAGTDKEALNKLSDCQLKALLGTPQDEVTNESELWKRLQEYRAENENLKARYQPIAENREKERVRMLDDVLAVPDRAWTDIECMNMSFEEIEKVHKAYCRRADYSGRGGPRSLAGNVLSFEVGSLLGSGQSVLGRKEN